MVDSGNIILPGQESAVWHFGTLEKFTYKPKRKWPPGDYVTNHKYHVTSLVLVLERQYRQYFFIKIVYIYARHKQIAHKMNKL